MSLRRKALRIVGVFLSAAAFMGCLLAAAYCFLPALVASRVKPILADRLGLSPDTFTFTIRRIGPFLADIGPVQAGPPASPAVRIDSIRIAYDPRELAKGRIRRIGVSGMVIQTALAEGRIHIPGMDLKEVDSRSGDSALPAAAPPFSVDELTISDTRVFVSAGDRRWCIPLEAKIRMAGFATNGLNARVTADLPGNRLTAVGRYDPSTGMVAMDMAADGLALAPLAAVAPLPESVFLTGQCSAEASTAFSPRPFGLSALSAVLECRRFRLNYHNTVLASPSAPGGTEVPLRLRVERGEGDKWEIAASDLMMAGLMPVRLKSATARLTIGSGSVDSVGRFSLQTEPAGTGPALPVAPDTPLGVEGRFTTSWIASDRWQFTLNAAGNVGPGTEGRRMTWIVPGGRLTSAPPVLTASGNGTNRGGTVNGKLELDRCDGSLAGMRLATRGVRVSGSGSIDLTGPRPEAAARFTLTAPQLTVRQASRRVEIPDFAVDGKMAAEARSARLEGNVKFTGGSLVDEDLGVRATGIRGTIPCHWPPVGEGRKGMVSVAGIRWQERNMGSVAAAVQQEGRQFGFTGTHISRLLPDLKLSFGGSTVWMPPGIGRTTVAFAIPPYQPTGEIRLESLAAAAEGMTATGTFSAKGSLSADAGGVRCSLEAAVENATVASPAKGLRIEGIAAGISVPDVFGPRTAPDQVVRFASAQLGDLKTGEGRISFRVDSPGVLFVEKGAVKWCGGNVETHALRLTPGQEQYELVLYGDRLLLSEILEQLGAARAEGGGRLNGKIPLRIEKGRVSFDGGFLHSTPGEGGTIRLLETDVLTAGIPGDTPQYIQLELAREALKEYTYRWVKLNMNSQADTLLLQMQMDGKPARPLPFVFDPDSGGFRRAEADGQGSIFQGISLDVNFRLPLDKFLTYKEMFRHFE